MNDIIKEYQGTGLTEAYEVVKTAEVVVNRKIYRLEVLKFCSNSQIRYKIRYCKLESVILQQSDMTGGKFDREPEAMRVFVEEWGRPWVDTDDPEKALHQALNFLTGRE